MIENITQEMFKTFKEKAAFLSDMKDMSEAQFRVIMETTLAKLDLVSREEFEAQKAVLLRTREKLEALETQLDALVQGQSKQV